jgi:hypothetical protein
MTQEPVALQHHHLSNLLHIDTSHQPPVGHTPGSDRGNSGALTARPALAQHQHHDAGRADAGTAAGARQLPAGGPPEPLPTALRRHHKEGRCACAAECDRCAAPM